MKFQRFCFFEIPKLPAAVLNFELLLFALLCHALLLLDRTLSRFESVNSWNALEKIINFYPDCTELY
jgi:hypothetical protein